MTCPVPHHHGFMRVIEFYSGEEVPHLEGSIRLSKWNFEVNSLNQSDGAHMIQLLKAFPIPKSYFPVPCL
jgi:hypothetical protein